jgi:beta-glucanase (GH16 family)
MVAYTFRDEFNGAAGSPPNPSLWHYDLGRWTDNNEQETYTNSTANCFQDGNSNLVIRATKKLGRNNRPQYYSARITTEDSFSQYLGHFEARIKVNSGLGLWPAWWSIGSSMQWPQCGEIDFLESYGLGDSYVETSVHTPVGTAPNQDIHTAEYDIRPLDSGFHVYRMDWGPKLVQFFRDNTMYFSVSQSQIPNWCYNNGEPLFMILNLAVGGDGGGDAAKAVLPADFVIDYVRAWAE